jgi:Uma2 family endonuclease
VEVFNHPTWEVHKQDTQKRPNHWCEHKTSLIYLEVVLLVAYFYHAFLVHILVGGFTPTKFRDANCIESPTFPELKLTAEQVFAAGNQA